eukprot:s3472_g3.t1
MQLLIQALTSPTFGLFLAGNVPCCFYIFYCALQQCIHPLVLRPRHLHRNQQVTRVESWDMLRSAQVDGDNNQVSQFHTKFKILANDKWWFVLVVLAMMIWILLQDLQWRFDSLNSLFLFHQGLVLGIGK